MTQPVSYVPNKVPGFIKFGKYDALYPIIKEAVFFPVYIVGLSGFGKTLMVEQICAELGREMIRINIHPRTDEDDLIGGLRLRNGNTNFEDGPVLTAMRRGAVLLLDETDRGSNNLMCIQSILEGKPFYIKKTGEIVTPAPGFNVVATANTKGRGSDDGRYSAAVVIDDAWLERFPVTIEVDPPTDKVQKEILLAAFTEQVGDKEEEFADYLTKWAKVTQLTFKDGGSPEYISTRRLDHIVKAYRIYDSKLEAIQACIARFDDMTKQGFLDAYTKIDPNPAKKRKKAGATTTTNKPAGMPDW